jgi:hypothetical protein
MSISRLLSRPQAPRGGVNMPYEQALREFGCGQRIPGMSQLINESGQRGPIVTTAFALYWIGLNPEWTREEL